MLAATRELRINGKFIANTPSIVPSFSSKGFPDVNKIVESVSGVLTDSVLISAYDISYEHLKTIPQSTEYMILDSGGYECSKDVELSDTRSNNYHETIWSSNQLVKVLDQWSSRVPTFAVSYDHPKERIKLTEQVARANDLFTGRSLGRELLVKPESDDSARVDTKEIIRNIDKLIEFDVIGFTEAELGYSIFDRMVRIAKIRSAISATGANTPIHIFGSLDTVSTPLYFLSGADVFDGLTWLRYAYLENQAVYIKNAAALKMGIRINDADVDPYTWFENYQHIQNLQLSMKRYLREQSFSVFGKMASTFEQWFMEMRTSLPQGS